MKHRTILGAVIGALALAATVRADLMPAAAPNAPGTPPPPVQLVNGAQDAHCSNALDPVAPADTQALLVKYSPDWESTTGPADAHPPTRILSERPSSFGLCLYTLIGLGLFHSVPLVKKLSLGTIPDWYHSGGPFQMGHSYAIGPDLRCVPVYCFIQPDGPAPDCTLEHEHGTIVSLWRKSQFTPAVLSPRAPPEE